MDTRWKLPAIAFALVFALSAAPAWTAEPIKIGMFIELTGANSEAGKQLYLGALMAQEDVNRAGGVLGRPLEVVFEDNQSTNPGTELAMAKLLGNKEIKGIITSNRSTQILAVMPAIAQGEIPTIIGGSQYALTHSGNRWVFRARTHDGYHARVMADFGTNTLQKRKWGIVHSVDGFGVDAKNLLIQELAKRGVQPVAVQGVNTDALNYAPVIAVLKKAQVDIVAMYVATGRGVGEFVKEFRQAGLDSVLVGSASLGQPDAERAAGEAIFGSYWISESSAGTNSQDQMIQAKYASRFKNESVGYAVWGYDAVQVLALGINNGGSTDPESIRKGLLAIRRYQGGMGTYDFDAFGDGLHGLNILMYGAGKRVFVRGISYSPP